MQTVLGKFKDYQRARVDFVQSMAQLALREQHVSIMENAGVMDMLKPLLEDNVPGIQVTAALALGRLASYSETISKSIIDSGTLPHLIKTLKQDSPHARNASAFVIRSMAKHSPEMADTLVQAGVLAPLTTCLEHVDAKVKESGAWALDYIAQHSASLSEAVVKSGALPLLVMCLEEPEQSLKRIAASTLSDIAKHSPKFAQAIVDSNALNTLAILLKMNDASLLRHVCACIAQIVKHSAELCDQITKHGILNKVIECLHSEHVSVRHNAMICVREVAKRSLKHSSSIVETGCIKIVLDLLKEGDAPSLWLPGAMVLGFIAGHSAEHASKIIDLDGVPVLKNALADGQQANNETRAAVAWALGQIGRHSPTHARVMGEAGIFSELLSLFRSTKTDSELRSKVSATLEITVAQCTEIDSLESLMNGAHPEVLKYVLHQFVALLPNSTELKRKFVENGILRRVQEIDREDDDDGEIGNLVSRIRRCFPQEVADYYAPGNDEKLLERHFGT